MLLSWFILISEKLSFRTAGSRQTRKELLRFICSESKPDWLHSYEIVLICIAHICTEAHTHTHIPKRKKTTAFRMQKSAEADRTWTRSRRPPNALQNLIRASYDDGKRCGDRPAGWILTVTHHWQPFLYDFLQSNTRMQPQICALPAAAVHVGRKIITKRWCSAAARWVTPTYLRVRNDPHEW